MSPAGFETPHPESDRPRALVLDRSATGIGITLITTTAVLVKWRENVVFTRNSTVYFNHTFFILGDNQALISSIVLRPSDYADWLHV